MRGWSWQKLVGKFAPLIATGLAQAFVFFEMEVPGWAPVVAGIVTFVAQQLLSLFPVDE